MTGDYSELYLDDVMTNLGEMVEYATVACGMDIDEFWDMFLRSDESAGLRASTPFMFCGRSGTETAMRVISEADPIRSSRPPSPAIACSPNTGADGRWDSTSGTAAGRSRRSRQRCR